MLVVPYAVCGDGWMVAGCALVLCRLFGLMAKPYLTCSETRLVVPESSSHLPKNSSPRKGFRGFFSVPYLSDLLLYDCFKVVKNHFSTSNARLAGSFSEAGATKMEGCSVQ